MTDTVTAILLNYRRPKNIPMLVEALRGQSVRVGIWLINNSPEMIAADVDRMVWIPWNGGCFARLLLASYVNAEWVFLVDDDVMPSDRKFIEDLIHVAECYNTPITGLYGQQLGQPPRCYDKRKGTDGYAPLIKGPVWLVRRSHLGSVNLARPEMAAHPEYLKRCEDLYLSLELGHGEDVHWADVGLRERVKQLPGPELGLCREPAHYEIRNQFCCDYLNWTGHD